MDSSYASMPIFVALRFMYIRNFKTKTFIDKILEQTVGQYVLNVFVRTHTVMHILTHKPNVKSKKLI